MEREENVLKFYYICNRLKILVRTGWKDWNVKGERLESVAEHIYQTQMLAFSMYKEFNYELNIEKVIMMLAIHELGETIIGDLTLFDISKEEKETIEHEAVHNLLSNIISYEELENLFLEFDKKESKEAAFAYQIDKLECDLQSKIYDEENRIDLNNQEGNKSLDYEEVINLLNEGNSFSEMWLKFGQNRYNYDENFMKVSNYALTHKFK